MERVYITSRGTSSTPASSVLASTASKASKILATAAESAAAVRGGEKWWAMDHLRYLFVLSAWVNVWILRFVADFFSSSSSPSVGPVRDARCHRFVNMERPSVTGNMQRRSSCSTAIGRALSHILEILNKTPATSRKYEFVLATGDRIISDNLQCNDAALLDVNREALAVAFSRTCDLLCRSLRSAAADASATWPSRILRLLPLGPHLSAWYDAVRVGLRDLIIGHTDGWGPSRDVVSTGANSCSITWLEAEKLAHELLWITEKMKACSMEGEATAMWGFASGLASLCLAAHPRVQGPIIKISAILFRELGRGEWDAPSDTRFRILAVWLPLLCYASNGVSCPVLVGMERWETERAIEDLISGLPWVDQEVILGNWLEDFAATDSDWPNLERCFDRWCQQSRKLLC